MRLGSIPSHVNLGFDDWLQQGVTTGGTVARASGTSVSVGAGICWITNPGTNGTVGAIGGDFGQRQGSPGMPPAPLVRNYISSGTITISIPTFTRLDQIIVPLVQPGGYTSPVLVLGKEIDTTLATRLGAVSDTDLNRLYPQGWIRLADIKVDPTTGVTAAANIRDRRTWARGFRAEITYSVADWTRNNAAWGNIQAGTELQIRAELSGAPVRLSMYGFAAGNVGIDLENGVLGTATYPNGIMLNADAMRGTNAEASFTVVQEATAPTAGSYLFTPRWYTLAAGTIFNTGTTTGGGANRRTLFVVEELLRSANNGTT